MGHVNMFIFVFAKFITNFSMKFMISESKGTAIFVCYEDINYYENKKVVKIFLLQ